MDPVTRQLALACLLLFLSGVSVILVSDLFEFSWRYQLPALVTLVPGGALGIAVIIRSVRTRRSPGRQAAARWLLARWLLAQRRRDRAGIDGLLPSPSGLQGARSGRCDGDLLGDQFRRQVG